MFLENYIYIFYFKTLCASFRPCQETCAVALARAGTHVKYSASAIYRTRKILYFVDISNTEILHMDS